MSEYITVWVDDLPDLKRGEEITRCRDCAMFKPLAIDGKCNRSKYYQSWTEPDGFCAWAERRDA